MGSGGGGREGGRVESEEWRVGGESGEREGEWRVKSGEWGESGEREGEWRVKSGEWGERVGRGRESGE